MDVVNNMQRPNRVEYLEINLLIPTNLGNFMEFFPQMLGP